MLRTALVHDGLVRGLREVVRALDKRKAHLCVLADNCDEKNYTKLIEALCKEANVHLVRVPDNMQLGQWVGLCKIDKEGEARRIVKCSSCVVADFGVNSEALKVLLGSFQ